MYSVNVTRAMCGVMLVRLGLVCGACVFNCSALGSEPGTGESEHLFRTVTETFRNVKFLHCAFGGRFGACVYRCVALDSEPGTGESEHPFRSVRFFVGVFGDTETFRNVKFLHCAFRGRLRSVRVQMRCTRFGTWYGEKRTPVPNR